MLKLYCIVQNATPQRCFGPYTYCEATLKLKELGNGNASVAKDNGYLIAPLHKLSSLQSLNKRDLTREKSCDKVRV